ncbi:MAG: dienelactone hydrolase, partial [Rhodospirillales bacterium]|nr:dienelactone hydrolase [Rhodospirillales bacterium]
MPRGLLPFILLAGLGLPAATQPIAFGPGAVRPPGSGAMAMLHAPVGPGPHPAVLLLHGCSGITPTVRRWADRLAEWGYAALVPDSFGPRGVDNVCGQAGRAAPGTGSPDASRVPPRLREEDAFAAAAYLRSRPDVDPARVSVVGFSHGGTTALFVASSAVVERLGARPFAR